MARMARCVGVSVLALATVAGCAVGAGGTEAEMDERAEGPAGGERVGEAPAAVFSAGLWTPDVQMLGSASKNSPVIASAGNCVVHLSDTSSNQLYDEQAGTQNSDLAVSGESSWAPPALTSDGYGTVWMVHNGGGSYDTSLWMSVASAFGCNDWKRWGVWTSGDQQIPVQSETATALTMTNNNNTLFMVSTGPGDYYLRYTTYDVEAQTWSVTRSLPGAYTTTSVTPAVTTYKGKVYLVHKGISGAGLYVSSFDGSTWTTQTQIPYASAGSAPSIATYGGSLHLVYLPPSSTAIMYMTFDGSQWTHPTAIPNHEAAHAPSIAGINQYQWNGVDYSNGLNLVHDSGDGSRRLWWATLP